MMPQSSSSSQRPVVVLVPPSAGASAACASAVARASAAPAARAAASADPCLHSCARAARRRPQRALAQRRLGTLPARVNHQLAPQRGRRPHAGHAPPLPRRVPVLLCLLRLLNRRPLIRDRQRRWRPARLRRRRSEEDGVDGYAQRGCAPDGRPLRPAVPPPSHPHRVGTAAAAPHGQQPRLASPLRARAHWARHPGRGAAAVPSTPAVARAIGHWQRQRRPARGAGRPLRRPAAGRALAGLGWPTTGAPKKTNQAVLTGRWLGLAVAVITAARLRVVLLVLLWRQQDHVLRGRWKEHPQQGAHLRAPTHAHAVTPAASTQPAAAATAAAGDSVGHQGEPSGYGSPTLALQRVATRHPGVPGAPTSRDTRTQGHAVQAEAGVPRHGRRGVARNKAMPTPPPPPSSGW